MATRYWFEPRPGCPMIELGCGYHDKRGVFHPQNIKLTGGPARFLTQAAMKHARKYRGAGMVGDPPGGEWAVYGMHNRADAYLADAIVRILRSPLGRPIKKLIAERE